MEEAETGVIQAGRLSLSGPAFRCVCVYPQRPGSQKRPCDGGQRYEDRRLRPRQRRAQYRLLQKDHQREFSART